MSRFFVARPVQIEAVQWRGDLADIPTGWRELGLFELDDENTLIVHTPQGPADTRHGDWIVRGTAGEFYPVPPAIFEYKYEAAE